MAMQISIRITAPLLPISMLWHLLNNPPRGPQSMKVPKQTQMHTVKMDAYNTGVGVVPSHRLAKDNKSHPLLWDADDDKYCFWSTTWRSKHCQCNSNAAYLILRPKKDAASPLLAQTLQRSWRMFWMSFMVKECFPNIILSRYVCKTRTTLNGRFAWSYTAFYEVSGEHWNFSGSWGSSERFSILVTC